MTERKLATIRKIAEVKAIPDADKICAYRVDGWWVVDSVGKYQVDDLVVYLEVDSFVPHELAPFLSKGKEPREYEGVKGERLRSVRLKKQISQGLLLPILEDTIKGAGHLVAEGLDLTEHLFILKWERPMNAQLAGMARGNFPALVPKTDQPRIQNLTREFAEYQLDTWSITEKLDGCFTRNQYIETWDSGAVQIGQIVNQGLRPKLIGVASDGKLVPVEITQVFKNGKKDKWLDIHFETGLKMKTVGKSKKLRVTPNHRIFKSDMSEVHAMDIAIGDELLMNAQDLCDRGIHYVRSSLLGDGSIGGNGHYSYDEGHATKYPKYLEYICNIFKNIKTSTRKQISGYGSEIQHIKVYSTPEMQKIRRQWYPDGIKRLPDDISWIDNYSVAKWYMDDGSLAHSEKQNDRALFATNAFTEKDVKRLAERLKEMYNVDVSITHSKGWSLRINWSNGTIKNFWEAIAPHVIDEQRYKLPVEYRSHPYVEYGAVNYVRKTIPVIVKSVEDVPVTKQNFPSGSVGYDIETTSHNYFCGGILVHNSSATFYLDADDIFHVCSRNLDLKEDEANSFWKVARKFKIEDIMKHNFMKGMAIQGEMIGEGIQGNQYKVQLDFYVYDMYNTATGQYILPAQLKAACEKLGLKHVPIINENATLVGETIDSILAQAEGKSVLNGSNREGLVWKSNTVHDRSWKSISNSWLIKNE